MPVQHKLRQDPGGNIEILILFWNFARCEGKENHLASAVGCLDLLRTGAERCREIALQFYEQSLAGLDQ
ncbi:MAG: type IV toxin-antitoxin system AbiEi family antitoxin [Blastocatellia bacterium]|nr:type IV toxin-antitoxin system AbiEi family antitoxin [Blastocatellia bacterium]